MDMPIKILIYIEKLKVVDRRVESKYGSDLVGELLLYLEGSFEMIAFEKKKIVFYAP